VTTYRTIPAEEFRELASQAASIYGAAMQRSPEVVVQRRDIINNHVGFRGFVAVGAFEPDLIGFGYGYLGRPGQWWHDVVAGALGREGSKRWLRDSFELAELHLVPSHHGQGIGRELLTRLLAEVDARHAVLSTPDTESPARLLYRSYGFVDIRCDFQFPGSPEVYAIMGVDL
jgi:ribosomal protein S18 acetylase RimI-like enzyme